MFQTWYKILLKSLACIFGSRLPVRCNVNPSNRYSSHVKLYFFAFFRDEHWNRVGTFYSLSLAAARRPNFCGDVYPRDQFLPVGRHRPCGHAPTLRYFFVFSHLSTCFFLSSLIALHFLKNPSEDFKNLFNQSEGEDCNGVWNWLGLYWNKFWLC